MSVTLTAASGTSTPMHFTHGNLWEGSAHNWRLPRSLVRQSDNLSHPHGDPARRHLLSRRFGDRCNCLEDRRVVSRHYRVKHQIQAFPGAAVYAAAVNKKALDYSFIP